MPEQRQPEKYPQGEGHVGTWRATGTIDTVVWRQWSPETLALPPLEQIGMLLYVTVSKSFSLSCTEFL